MPSLCCRLVYVYVLLLVEWLINSTTHLCAGSSLAELLSASIFLSNLKTFSDGKENNLSHLPPQQQKYRYRITF